MVLDSDPRTGHNPIDRRVVICLGNPLMGDDGIGIRVAKALLRRSIGKNVAVYACQGLDLSLIEKLEGASVVVLVDALRSGKPPGTVSRYSISSKDDLPVEIPSLHGLRLPDLLALANDAGLLACPMIVVGVEPKNFGPGRRMSRELKSSIPTVVDEVVASLKASEASDSRR